MLPQLVEGVSVRNLQSDEVGGPKEDDRAPGSRRWYCWIGLGAALQARAGLAPGSAHRLARALKGSHGTSATCSGQRNGDRSLGSYVMAVIHLAPVPRASARFDHVDAYLTWLP